MQNRRVSSYAFAVKLFPTLHLILDTVVILLCGYGLYLSLVDYSYRTYDFYNAAIIISWLLTIMLFYFGGLYQFEAIIKFSRTADRIVIAVITTFVFLVSLGFAVKATAVFSRIWVVAFAASCVFGLLLVRGVISWFLRHLGKDKVIARNLAVYGTGVQVQDLASYLDRTSPPFVRICGVYTSTPAEVVSLPAGFQRLGDLEDLIARVRVGEIDDIVIALPWADHAQVQNVVQRLRELPTYVYLCVDSIGFRLQLRDAPDYFQQLPFFEVIGKPLSGSDAVIKMLEDYVLATLLVICCLPIFVVVAILIKVTSPGPILFVQKRFGFNNQPFDIYKFRSMTYQPSDNGKTIQAARDDPRVTSIGRFIRRTSIDELPQLLNVLNGTMSLVGPRPHAVDHNVEYAMKISGYFARHRVKPGITGLAQVKGFRGRTETDEKMEGRVKYDIEYVDNWSLLMDLKVLVSTAVIIITGENAY